MTQFCTCKPALMEREEFIANFGDIYEHSAWVAQRVYDMGLNEHHNQVAQLHQSMSEVLNNADDSEKLALINAHPDLAGKAAVNGELTAASTAEQAGAGIDQCTAAEFERFTQLNDQYKQRFNFPFIMAVKGANRFQILDSFEARIHNDPETEFATALNEINKIALFRLQAM